MSLGDPLRRRNAVRPTPVIVGMMRIIVGVFGASSSPSTAVIVASRAPRRGPDLEDAMAFPRPIGRRIRAGAWWPPPDRLPLRAAGGLQRGPARDLRRPALIARKPAASTDIDERRATRHRVMPAPCLHLPSPSAPPCTARG